MLEIFEIWLLLLRLVLLFFVALVVVRLMGNRTIGQLSPFDFVIMVGIGDIIITSSMDKNSNAVEGIGSLAMLLILQQLLSYLALKSTLLRKWVEGQPVILIKNGRIIKENFTKTQFNYDDLRQELHIKGLDMSKLQEIKVARLESCGDFSIIKTLASEPLTKKEFENIIQSIYDNPLSLMGEKISRLEQAIIEIKTAADIIKQQTEKQIKEQTLLQSQH